MGKLWERGKPEPEKWMVDFVDHSPNLHGSPGLFGKSEDAEIYLDNISVTPTRTRCHSGKGRTISQTSRWSFRFMKRYPLFGLPCSPPDRRLRLRDLRRPPTPASLKSRRQRLTPPTRRPMSTGTNGAAPRRATIHPSATTSPPSGRSARSTLRPAPGTRRARRTSSGSRGSARAATAAPSSPAATPTSAPTTPAVGSSAIPATKSISASSFASTSKTANSFGSIRARSFPRAASTIGRWKASAARR